MKNKILVLSGPTASGKTSTSLRLALELQAEVVNFDSLLFYKELNIGTAKPTRAEQGNIPHHLIDVVSIASPLNASQFKKMATEVIDSLLSAGKKILLVGGSGFYLLTL